MYVVGASALLLPGNACLIGVELLKNHRQTVCGETFGKPQHSRIGLIRQRLGPSRMMSRASCLVPPAATERLKKCGGIKEAAGRSTCAIKRRLQLLKACVKQRKLADTAILITRCSNAIGGLRIFCCNCA